MSLNKSVLKNILSKTYNFCGICFDTLEDSAVHMQDDVVITKNGNENTIKICDMLYYVLGEEVMNVISIFEFLCKQCVRSLVSSHKFITMSRKNTMALKISLENLSSSIEKVTENHNYYKSLFITIDPQDFSTQEFFDIKSPATSVSSPCQKIETLMTQQQDTIIDKDSAANFSEELGEKSKKKRSNYASVHMKTTDMLYDKNDPNNLKCKECKRVYPSLSNLRNHYIRVHAPKDFKCSTCKRKFGSMGLLEQHKYQSHCTIVCTECGKTFYNRHTLKMHEIGHYIRIVCEDCGRVYKSQTTYKKHIDLNVCGRKTRAHPSDAKFTCDYCNKKYTQKISLRVHIQYEHGNYKAHVCKWCDKKFWARSRLKAHIVKHTQEKKFGCNVCGGKFVSKESLLYHSRIHTGEKPYKCNFCDNCFLSASRRAEHIKRHHSGAGLKCDICQAKFFRQQCLERHKKTHAETNMRKDNQNVSNIFEEDHLIYLRLPENQSDINQKIGMSAVNNMTCSGEAQKVLF